MEVQSEISPHFEAEVSSKPVVSSKNAVSKFTVQLPCTAEKDNDDDYVVQRKGDKKEVTFIIEHSVSTSLPLVGQQLWRGAFLLSDWIIYIGEELKGQTVLELGAGVGLTSLVTSLFADQVFCTDLDAGDILAILKENVRRNQKVCGKISVLGCDWFDLNWSPEFRSAVEKASVVIAADVVYDNTATEALVRTITAILNTLPKKTLYIALEKRYVFTLADLDTVAPCYEHLLQCLKDAQKSPPWNQWTLTPVVIDFPQRLSYERIPQLVLWKISV